MTPRLSSLAALLSGVALILGASVAQADTVVVTADRMLDVVTGTVVEKAAVVVTDGRIAQVGKQGSVSLPSGARRVALPAGMTLLPGLIDMHVHLTSDPRISGYRGLQYTDSFWQVVGVANAKKTVEAGFTTVRNVGSRDFDDVGLKQGIEGGYIPGPRIVPATYAIGATGGHCDGGGLPPSLDRDTLSATNGADAFRAKIRKLRKYGAEVLKLCGTGGVFSKTDSVGGQQMTQAEFDAAIDEAHMLGMKVAVHAHGAEGINAALRAGVDTVEHASLANAESFRLAKEHGAWFSMDIYNDDYIMAEGAKNGVYAESLAKEKEIGLKQRQTFSAAVKAGVKMVFGTDGGVYPNGDNARQFAKMVEWGMTPIQAIRAATSEAAEALGRTKDVGAIEVGRYGDLIAVAGDPLADVRKLETVAFVMKGGEVVKAPPSAK